MRPKYKELQKLYVEDQSQIRDTAKIFHVSDSTVWKWLQFYKIDTHSKRWKKKRGTMEKCKNCEIEFYVPPNRKKSGRGKYCSKKCFYEDRYNTNKLKDKNWLKKESEIKTMQQIAEELQCNIRSVDYWRKKFGIHSKLRPSDNVEWKPTRIRTCGYIRLQISNKNPYYKMSDNGKILEHRLIMAEHLGRCLETWEIVHHKNRIRDDNGLENLELITS